MVVARMTVWFRRPAQAGTTRARSETQSFEALLTRAKQLEAIALGEVYQRFLPVVFGYVAARVADRPLAEDITSEVFVSMLESIGKLHATDEAGFAAWLLKIARFRVADHFRAQATRPTLASGMVTNDEGEASELLLTLPAHDPAGNPELRAEVREEWSMVAAAINQLTEEQQQVIIGKLVLGYDNETLAQRIGKNVAAVKALQHRGLQTLHRLLRGGRPEGPASNGAKRPVKNR
jgi:RNA polymerase sigma-70 factor (ECF subfamily)